MCPLMTWLLFSINPSLCQDCAAWDRFQASLKPQLRWRWIMFRIMIGVCSGGWWHLKWWCFPSRPQHRKAGRPLWASKTSSAACYTHPKTWVVLSNLSGRASLQTSPLCYLSDSSGTCNTHTSSPWTVIGLRGFLQCQKSTTHSFVLLMLVSRLFTLHHNTKSSTSPLSSDSSSLLRHPAMVELSKNFFRWQELEAWHVVGKQER